MSEIRALTVRRPWADLIRRGKNVENRVWDTTYRGAVLIHAGKRWEPTARWHAQDLVLVGSDYWQPARHPEGVVAVAQLAGVCAGTPCDCGLWAMDGNYHWQLAQVRALDVPVSARGRLGLWRVEPELVAAVEKQIGVLA